MLRDRHFGDKSDCRSVEKFSSDSNARAVSHSSSMARARRKGRHVQDSAGEKGQHADVPEDTNIPILLPKSLAAQREVEQVCRH